MIKFTKVNTLCKCRECGKRTHSSIDNDLDVQLCRKCYEDANAEIEHLDRHDEPKAGCKYCKEEK